LIRFRAEYFDIGSAPFRQLRMMLLIPGAGGELKSLTLFSALHLQPE